MLSIIQLSWIKVYHLLSAVKSAGCHCLCVSALADQLYFHIVKHIKGWAPLMNVGRYV